MWGGYVIEKDGKKIYFAGDTGYSPHFKEIEAKFGAPDLALLPIGAYSPKWFMGPVHMDPADAVNAHKDLKSRKSIGMHFGTFQLTSEGIDQPLIDLTKALNDRAIAVENFVTLGVGETRTF